MRMPCYDYMRKWLEAVDGDEKFVLTIGSGIVTTLLLIFHCIHEDTFMTLIISTVATYIGGAAVESFSRKPPEPK